MIPVRYYAVQSRHGYIVARHSRYWVARLHRSLVRGELLPIR